MKKQQVKFKKNPSDFEDLNASPPTVLLICNSTKSQNDP
jgi:hypothetical protein